METEPTIKLAPDQYQFLTPEQLEQEEAVVVARKADGAHSSVSRRKLCGLAFCASGIPIKQLVCDEEE